ncbi:hepcidin-like [Scophthalmus maximus]|uniref:hepcidin-like n=1 Tax=Scophthalmus maximus TaxID=52904 RepID=UPI000F3A70D9|nr:hepcidin-like [Scophthalmus maximus]
MKTFSAAVAVAVLVFVRIQAIGAFPFTGVQELAEAMSRDGAAAAREEETSAETWMLPYDVRRERYSGPVRCRYCCGCCALGVCGMCCE